LKPMPMRAVQVQVALILNGRLRHSGRSPSVQGARSHAKWKNARWLWLIRSWRVFCARAMQPEISQFHAQRERNCRRICRPRSANVLLGRRLRRLFAPRPRVNSQAQRGIRRAQRRFSSDVEPLVREWVCGCFHKSLSPLAATPINLNRARDCRGVV
jgi:hypothetical protein